MRSRSDPATQPPPAELPAARWVRWLAVSVFWGVLLLACAGMLILAIQASLISAPSRASAVPHTPAADISGLFSTALGLVTTIVFVMLLVLLLHSIGRYKLERHAWIHAPIDVADFGSVPGAPEDVSTAKLTAQFRTILANSRLSVFGAVPGTSGTDDFLSVVDSGASAETGWVRAVSQFIYTSIISPGPVYRVTGKILAPDENSSCILLIQVTRTPNSAASPLVIRDQFWDHAIERAAHAVAALVLPRSIHCQPAPWTSWRHRKIPEELFDNYQRARKYRTARRYDEALAALHRALELDPGNLHIRLEIGLLLEQLDMPLDALVTYYDVLTLGRQRSPARWPVLAKLSRWRAPDPVLLVAHYRYALLLGVGERLVDVWWRSPYCSDPQHWSARERQRSHMQQAASRRLQDCLADSRFQLAPVSVEGAEYQPTELVTATAGGADEQRRRKALRILLCDLGRLEMEELEARCRARWAWGPRRRRRLNWLLPHRCVRLALVWASLRYALAVHDAKAPHGRAPGVVSATTSRLLPKLNAVFERRPGQAAALWPPDPARLDAAVGEALNRRWRHGSWQEHYNAACTHAVALLPGSGSAHSPHGGPDADQPFPAAVAKEAVRQLRLAVSRSDSGFFPDHLAWLLTEDPDLQSLRARPEFHHFETEIFAPARKPPPRAGRVRVWEQVGYMGAIVQSAAERLTEIWADRALHAETATVHEVARWCREEELAWQMTARLAFDYRDWHTRARLLQQVSTWATGYSQPPLRVGFLSFSLRAVLRVQGRHDNGTNLDPADLAERVEHAITTCDKRMGQLYEALFAADQVHCASDGCAWRRDWIESLAGERQAWSEHVRTVRAGHGALDVIAVRQVCRLSTRRWQALARWYTDDGAGEPERERRRQDFVRTLQETERPRTPVPRRLGSPTTTHRTTRLTSPR